jgi:hypothetical protein
MYRPDQPPVRLLVVRPLVSLFRRVWCVPHRPARSRTSRLNCRLPRHTRAPTHRVIRAWKNGRKATQDIQKRGARRVRAHMGSRSLAAFTFECVETDLLVAVAFRSVVLLAVIHSASGSYYVIPTRGESLVVCTAAPWYPPTLQQLAPLANFVRKACYVRALELALYRHIGCNRALTTTQQCCTEQGTVLHRNSRLHTRNSTVIRTVAIHVAPICVRPSSCRAGSSMCPGIKFPNRPLSTSDRHHLASPMMIREHATYSAGYLLRWFFDHTHTIEYDHCDELVCAS